MLDGTIEVQDPGQFPIANGSASRIITAPQVTGTFRNAPHGEPIATHDGRGTVRVIYQNSDVLLADYRRNPPASQLLNISTRAGVGTGHNVAIGGFIVVGPEAKRVLLRGIGPSLVGHNIPGALQDPTIALHGPNGAEMTTNDNWKDTQEQEIRATGLAPEDDRESAIVATLTPGAYTLILRGANDTTGTGLVEVYDLTPESRSKLANISTRGFVDADNLLIGGFISGGSGPGQTEITVRGIGPRLAQSLSGFLPDPTVELRDENGALLVFNDDASQPPENLSTIAPGLRLFGLDAAFGAVLPPGPYTAIVRAKPGQSGIALVEIYDLNR